MTNGLGFATWASRLPAIRDDLGLSPAQLGLVLLAVAAGSVIALPTSGAVVHRLGPGRTVLAFGLLNAVSLAVVGSAQVTGVLVVGLFLLGAGNGMWDVAMNVEGADVERRLGRPIMPRFHGGWSLGTVAGAGLGALAARAGAGVGIHLATVSVLVAAAVVLATRWFRAAPAAGTAQQRTSGARLAWTERRTLLLGLLVFGMAFAEGVANDWLAVGFVDGYGASHATAAAGFGVFVTAMTLSRMVGPAVLVRVGRVSALRGSALMVIAGVALVVGGGWGGPGGARWAPGLAIVGALLWGLGAALAFPIGMSAAADLPDLAPARVSAVATIGYLAFLAGPPLLGLLAEHVGVIRAVSLVGVTMLLTLVIAPAARPPQVHPDAASTFDRERRPGTA